MPCGCTDHAGSALHLEVAGLFRVSDPAQLSWSQHDCILLHVSGTLCRTSDGYCEVCNVFPDSVFLFSAVSVSAAEKASDRNFAVRGVLPLAADGWNSGVSMEALTMPALS